MLLLASLALPGSSPEGGLHWEAPAGHCPSEAEVVSRLAALVGDAELSVLADAHVSPVADGWVLDLKIRWGDEGERRHLEAATCEELAEAVLVLLAVLAEEARGEAAELDSETTPKLEPKPEVIAVIEPPQPEPLAVQGQVGRPASEPVERTALNASADEVSGPVPPPAQTRSPRHRRAFALTTGGLADIGGLAGASFGVRLGVAGWLGRRLRWVAEGRYLPPRAIGNDANFARGGRIQLGYAHLAACVSLRRGRVEVPICGAFEVGGLQAAGFGDAEDQGARDLWLAAGVSTSFAITLAPRIALVVGLEVVAPLARQRYVYGPEILYETALANGRALLGLEFRLVDQIRPEAENP